MIKNKVLSALVAAGMSTSLTMAEAATTVTIGTVNNGDMIRMQSLTDEFEKAHPEIKLDWVVLEENEAVGLELLKNIIPTYPSPHLFDLTFGI